MDRQLTHNFNLNGTAGNESFGILGDTCVTGLVGVSLDVLDDQCSIGEDLLFPVDWQGAVI